MWYCTWEVECFILFYLNPLSSHIYVMAAFVTNCLLGSVLYYPQIFRKLKSDLIPIFPLYWFPISGNALFNFPFSILSFSLSPLYNRSAIKIYQFLFNTFSLRYLLCINHWYFVLQLFSCHLTSVNLELYAADQFQKSKESHLCDKPEGSLEVHRID